MTTHAAQLLGPPLRRPLVSLFLAALTLRLLVFGYIAHDPRKFYTYDSDGYDRRALNLLRYGQLASEAAPPLTPDLDRTPLYPLFLAAVFGVGGHSPWLAMLIQLLLGSLTPVVLYLLARELALPPMAGLAAGLIVALDPVSAMNANRMLTETIFTLLLVTGLWLLARYWRTLDWRAVLGSAVVLALAALMRPISQFLPIVLLPLFAVVWRKAGWRSALGGGAVFIALSLALTYSWAYRNYQVAGVFTLSTISDTNLIFYRARAVLADVENISQDEAWARLEQQMNSAVAAQGLSTAETVALQREMALGIFRAHPGATLKMLTLGVARILVDPGYTITCTLLDQTSTAFECFPGKSTMNEPSMLGKALGRVGQMGPAQLFALAWSATLLCVVYLGAVVGGVRLLRERRWLALALLLVVSGYFIGLAAGAESNSRFRVPVLPGVALLAGCGLALLPFGRRAQGRAKVATPASTNAEQRP